jgi:hypothetical protein
VLGSCISRHPTDTVAICLKDCPAPSRRSPGSVPDNGRTTYLEFKISSWIYYWYVLHPSDVLEIPHHHIGKHLRHARDHFVLLMDSVATSPPQVLSYDTRSRNTPMESSRTVAREALLEAIKQLETVVPTVRMTTPITLQAITPFLQEFETTFGREVCRALCLGSQEYLRFGIALVCGPSLCAPLVNGRFSVLQSQGHLNIPICPGPCNCGRAGEPPLPFLILRANVVSIRIFSSRTILVLLRQPWCTKAGSSSTKGSSVAHSFFYRSRRATWEGENIVEPGLTFS